MCATRLVPDLLKNVMATYNTMLVEAFNVLAFHTVQGFEEGGGMCFKYCYYFVLCLSEGYTNGWSEEDGDLSEKEVIYYKEGRLSHNTIFCSKLSRARFDR